MKKMLIAMLIIGIALVSACTSSPPPEVVLEDDEAFKDIYDRHKKDLILDGAEKHKVVYRDTLSAISRTKYKNGFYFPIIMMASSDVVLDPDKIIPGMILTIPDIQKNLDDANARASIKAFLEEIAVLQDHRKRPRDAVGLRRLADSL